MSIYTYSPLKGLDVRVLDLQPGKFGEPLVAELLHRDLDPKHDICPSFEAISYTWGDQSNPVPIHLISKDESLFRKFKRLSIRAAEPKGPGTIQIGQNLAAALQQLRYKDRPRLIWADSICINQQDLNERAAQVLRMGDIFRGAERVVVWLGLPTADTDLALDALKYAASQIDISDEALDMKKHGVTRVKDADPKFKATSKESPFTTRQWEALAEIVSRKWFQRLWIWQEIVLANSRSLMLIGDKQMLWLEFISAVECLSATTCISLDSIARADFKRNLKIILAIEKTASSNSAVVNVVDRSRHCECTDNRDRVYALLSIIPKRISRGIMPDYTLEVKEVYKSMVVQLIKQTGELGLLTLCFHATKPTWVLDLDKSGERVNSTPASYSECGSEAKIRLLGNDLLEVWGVQCDEIVEQIATVPAAVTSTEMRDILTTVARRVLGYTFNEPQYERLEMVTETVLSGRAIKEKVRTSHSTVVSCVPILERWIFGDSLNVKVSPAEESIEDHFLRHSIACLRGLSLYMTKKGALINGVRDYQSGDKIAVLLGVARPIVLRATNTQATVVSGSHEVISCAYHPGYACGEALLGPLPEGWRLLYNQKGKHGIVVFKNDDGGIQLQDPRLEGIELPKGWTEETSEDGDLEWFDSSGKRGADPRLRIEALQGRGVSVERIVLT